MEAERWTVLKGLLEAALELPPSERPRWLGTACPDDADLRREIEQLLAMDGLPEGVLEPPGGEGLGWLEA